MTILWQMHLDAQRSSLERLVSEHRWWHNRAQDVWRFANIYGNVDAYAIHRRKQAIAGVYWREIVRRSGPLGVN